MASEEFKESSSIAMSMMNIDNLQIHTSHLCQIGISKSASLLELCNVARNELLEYVNLQPDHFHLKVFHSAIVNSPHPIPIDDRIVGYNLALSYRT